MKYAVQTKWHWKDGIFSAEKMQEWMKDVKKGNSLAEDVILWKIDNQHHGALVIYASEEIANKERAIIEAERKENNKNGASIIEETMGPITARMSEI
ncbi:MAG: hypothetical protein ACJZ8V_04570 [Paracoccaceae bacterium]|tara:strand:+ start:134 stop:424 length:291 start_codon:yes stop_codon:yes gene_type:complete